jgi:hypothetical protein
VDVNENLNFLFTRHPKFPPITKLYDGSKVLTAARWLVGGWLQMATTTTCNSTQQQHAAARSSTQQQ